MALGFEQAGFDVVCTLEVDPTHAAVHRFNFPLCEVVQADATRVSGARLRRAVAAGLARHGRADERARIDVVFGGPPCQGFSVGGLLDAEDPRNRLVEDFARLVASLGPRAFVLENVPAMASRTLPGERDVVPEWLRRRMAVAGYAVGAPWVLNAAWYGVPQDRRRLVVVGVRGRAEVPTAPTPVTAARPRCPDRPLRPGDVGHGATPAGRPVGPTVADALGDLADLDDFDELLHRDWVRLPAEVRQAAARRASPYAKRLADRAGDGDFARPRARTPSVLSSSLRTVHAPDVVLRFAGTKVGQREPISRFVRLHPDGVSGTLRAGSTPDRGSFSAPRPIHPNRPRVISVREAARLHGYPDWFRFSAAKWHGFRQVGNSVCPPLAKAVAESVRDALELPVIAAESRLSLGSPTLLLVASGAGRRPRGGRRANRAA